MSSLSARLEVLDPPVLLQDGNLHQPLCISVNKSIFLKNDNECDRLQLQCYIVEYKPCGADCVRDRTFSSKSVDCAKASTSSSRYKTSEENTSLRASRAHSTLWVPREATGVLAMMKHRPLVCLLKLDSRSLGRPGAFSRLGDGAGKRHSIAFFGGLLLVCTAVRPWSDDSANIFSANSSITSCCTSIPPSQAQQ